MKKIIVYAATSLDGKIAKPDGSVSWLEDVPNPEKSDYGYGAFYKSIDTTLMGNKTYQQVLGFDLPFPYPDKKNYVFTTNDQLDKDENVTYISNSIVPFIQGLKAEKGKDIWLVGGGQINTLLLNNGLIDELIVFIMPVIIGSGIPLFTADAQLSKLSLKESKTHSSGVIELIYTCNPAAS